MDAFDKAVSRAIEDELEGLEDEVSSPAASEEVIPKFEFDAEFQTQIAALALRDYDFLRKSAHLLRPEYFENEGEAALTGIVLKHFEKYGEPPSLKVISTVIKQAITDKLLRKELVPVVAGTVKSLAGLAVTSKSFVEEKLVEFAQYQAVSNTILKAVGMLEARKLDQIVGEFKKAVDVGLNDDGDEYDYFDRLKERTEKRADRLAGKMPPQGITTGHLKLDELLYHRGWGRKELSVIMGPAKSGKTAALVSFAQAACLAGHNVLYVTLEVSREVISERFDANFSGEMVKALARNLHTVAHEIETLQKRSGKLKIVEYPSGAMTPNMLRRVIERYKAKGVIFDLMVVDYGDIMAPNYRYNDPIENSKSIFVDLRAIASEENAAMLTATQTNRAGAQATVVKMEHVAEDFNKVRIADIMLSINISEEERVKGEARLYFAASRNQESGFTVFLKQDISRMQFIKSILRVE